MKILELLDPKVSHEPIKTKSNLSDMYKKRGKGRGDGSTNPFFVSKDYESGETEQIKNKLVKTVGSGLYGTAFSHKHRPGEIVKVSKPTQSLENDAYYNYISAVLKNGRMQSNPYFPKIYGMKVYETADGWFFYKLSMEKLYPLSDLNEDEIGAILEKTLHISSEQNDHLEELHVNLQKVIGAIEKGIGHGNHSNFPNKKDVSALTNIKDPQLKQAVTIVKQFTRAGEHTNDIHSGNVMFRRTQYGAQLVITDPIS